MPRPPMNPVLAGSDSESFGRKEWTVLLALLTLNFTFGVGLSLQGPFYPAEATKKNLTASVYGAVLGFYFFMLFISTPIVGSFMLKGRLGVRRCLLLTYFSFGTCLILYGLLDFISSTSLFTIFSFLVRGIDGFGSSGTPSQFIIMNTVFPKQLGLVVGTFEFMYLLGLSTGPLLGELIYQDWGYTATFATFGVLVLCLLLPTSCLFPDIQEIPRIRISGKDLLDGLLKLLKIPEVDLFLFTSFITAGGTTFMLTILEPDIRQFNPTALETGEAFLFLGAPQILCPLWGYIVDNGMPGELIALAGGIIATIGITVVGPVTFVPLNPTVQLTTIGLVLFGLGQGGLIACNFYNIRHGTRSAEASIIWVAVCYIFGGSLGGTFGSTVAGVLFDYGGFRTAATFLWGCYVLMTILIMIFAVVNDVGQSDAFKEEVISKRQLPKIVETDEENSETTPLMNEVISD